MSKSIPIDGKWDKTIRSELSHGDYDTSYDEVVPPNYLVHIPSQNDVIMDIDMEEELNERENGGGLDDCGNDKIDFDDTMREVEL